eukprot:TRINITY_DN28128_c0_g1_i1.p1 TRINITY_DN28128_c0_g1~~TRINITY_DN28128_c0_g1_i1.p1  ORF type:complete len:639 (-),score=144.52 TRINITY_DN28128_c0_g1_i1:86-2002(-)
MSFAPPSGARRQKSPPSSPTQRSPPSSPAQRDRRVKDAVAPPASGRATPSPSTPKQRPRSAQLRRPQVGPRALVHKPSVPMRTLAETNAAAANAARVMEDMRNQCRDLKCAANSVAKDTMKTRTRCLALDRELQKREKLLRAMIQAQQSGGGVSMEIIEKLREERNMLPIYHRKIHALHQEMQDRNDEMKKLKRDPRYTRIIELQVEMASWQHETKRLEHLLEDKSLDTPVAQSEVKAHEELILKLEAELAAQNDIHSTRKDELKDLEEDHAEWESYYKEKAKNFEREKSLTLELAQSQKKRLQKLKEAEKFQDEAEYMIITKRKNEKEMMALEEGQSVLAGLSSQQSDGLEHCLVFRAPLEDTPLQLCAEMHPLLLPALRRAVYSQGSKPSDSLYHSLRESDKDCDGLLSGDELQKALGAWSLCPSQPSEACAVLRTLLPEEAKDKIRWLDLLAALDLLPAPQATPLPAFDAKKLWPMRAACLRHGIGSEELRQQIASVRSWQEMQGLCTSALGLNDSFAADLVHTWQQHGSHGFLFNLPLNEVTKPAAAIAAWSARCISAVQKHKEELRESFTWMQADMLLSEANFRMMCNDIMGVLLSEEDIADLALVAGGDPTAHHATVHGSWVLELATTVAQR